MLFAEFNFGLVIAPAAVLADNPGGPISLETRWWNEHEIGWRLAESAGRRWAITDGIAGRARVGGENVPARTIGDEFERQTAIKAEDLGGVLVLHRPNEARRKELEAKLSAGGEAAVRAGWLLGWLKDAHAWPALARAAAGKDVAVALSSAQALRRLDGEEPFTMRRWVISGTFSSASIYGKTPPDDGVWQAPLGLCFPNAVSAVDLEALANSPWVPLREAAARLSAGNGDAGKALAERLTRDASLTVRQAAERTLRAWHRPEGGFTATGRPVVRCDLAAQWEAFNKGGSAMYRSGAWIAAFGGDDDISKLFELAFTSPDVHRVALVRDVLAANVGGRMAVDGFRKLAVPGKAAQHGRYGLAMVLDGAALARELGPLLGSDNNTLVSEFLLARFAGPAALPHLEAAIAAAPEKVGHVVPLAEGFIGGPDVVPMLARRLKSSDLSTALAAARGLGDTGQASAVAPLVRALGSNNRVLRSRAALGLGRIGGPQAAQALAERLAVEKDYLVRRSASRMLREIGRAGEAHAELLTRVERELDSFVPAYAPVNPAIGERFPLARWTPIGEERKVGPVGEIRTAVDSHCGLVVVYGGCGGRGYNNECAGFDVASGKWFWIRPWENLGLFYNESRANMGCSRGIAYDPKGRRVWINHAVGGSGTPYNEYLRNNFCSYDVALDRFDGSMPPTLSGQKFLLADSRRGLILPAGLGPAIQAVDGSTGQSVELKYQDAPDIKDIYPPDPQAYDPVSDCVLHAPSDSGKGVGPASLWLFDQARRLARKSASPLPGELNHNAQGMAYDSLNRQIVLFLPNGAWRYDRDKDDWAKVADGACGVYLTVGFDPQHNVFLGFKDNRLQAFRLGLVTQGVKAFYGDEP